MPALPRGEDTSPWRFAEKISTHPSLATGASGGAIDSDPASGRSGAESSGASRAWPPVAIGQSSP